MSDCPKRQFPTDHQAVDFSYGHACSKIHKSNRYNQSTITVKHLAGESEAYMQTRKVAPKHLVVFRVLH